MTIIKKLKFKFFRCKKKYFETFFYRKNINLFLLKNRKPVLVTLPTVDWDSPLYQRPQHLALQLSKLGFFYFYTTYNNHSDHVNGFVKINENLILTDKYTAVPHAVKDANIILCSTQQLTKIEEIKKYRKAGNRIIYDYIDEINPEISDGDKQTAFIRSRHQSILNNHLVDFIFCVSNKLYQEVLKYYPKEKVLLSPNGVDYQHFQIKKEEKLIPNDLKEIVSLENPIIGYYGAIASWLDYELINDAAKNNPNWQFVFIGIDYNDGLKKLNQELKNIHFLGAKSYYELPKYAIWFDVALIPFVKGEIAQATSPLKMYEYMAMRKPIVVTEDLLECHGFEGVYVSKNDKNDFAEKIKLALKNKDDQRIMKELDNYAKNNTWEKRAKEIKSILLLKKN